MEVSRLRRSIAQSTAPPSSNVGMLQTPSGVAAMTHSAGARVGYSTAHINRPVGYMHTRVCVCVSLRARARVCVQSYIAFRTFSQADLLMASKSAER